MFNKEKIKNWSKGVTNKIKEEFSEEKKQERYEKKLDKMKKDAKKQEMEAKLLRSKDKLMKSKLSIKESESKMRKLNQDRFSGFSGGSDNSFLGFGNVESSRPKKKSKPYELDFGLGFG